MSSPNVSVGDPEQCARFPINTFGNDMKMINPIKQYVPSHVCLKCDGCCRFLLSESPWRPKVGEQEIVPQLDAQGFVKTVAAGEHQQCVFFNPSDNTCGVYQQRPFECSLYPFILSKTSQGIKMYVHLACPHIQDNEMNDDFQQHVDYLNTFFNQPQTKDFLQKNSRLLHDYSNFEPELRFLFNVGV